MIPIQIENGLPFNEFIELPIKEYIGSHEVKIESILCKNIAISFREEALLEISKIITPFIYTRFIAFKSSFPYLTQKGIYSGFVDCFKKEITENIRELGLAKIAQSKVDECFSEYITIANRVDKDKKHLLDVFSFNDIKKIEIQEISKPMSDAHYSGSVRQIIFSGNIKLIYKPRTLTSERHWQKLVKWLNDNGRGSLYASSCYCIGDEYGWMEYINNNEIVGESGLKEYYINMGELLFWLWLFGARDIVKSNLVACGEKPILIDCETIFYPYLKQFENNLVSTGALPTPQLMLDGSTSHKSAIALSKNSKTVALICDCESLDNLEIKYKKTDSLFSNNVPIFNGNKVHANNFLPELISGFKEAASFAMQNKKRLNDSFLFANSEFKTRIVLRPTIVYGNIILKLLENPKLLYGKNEVRKLLANLPINYNICIPARDAIIDMEVESLSKMMIPSFYLEDIEKNELLGIRCFFNDFKSGKKTSSERLKNLSSELVKIMCTEICSCIKQG